LLADRFSLSDAVIRSSVDLLLNTALEEQECTVCLQQSTASSATVKTGQHTAPVLARGPSMLDAILTGQAVVDAGIGVGTVITTAQSSTQSALTVTATTTAETKQAARDKTMADVAERLLSRKSPTHLLKPELGKPGSLAKPPAVVRCSTPVFSPKKTPYAALLSKTRIVPGGVPYSNTPSRLGANSRADQTANTRQRMLDAVSRQTGAVSKADRPTSAQSNGDAGFGTFPLTMVITEADQPAEEAPQPKSRTRVFERRIVEDVCVCAHLASAMSMVTKLAQYYADTAATGRTSRTYEVAAATMQRAASTLHRAPTAGRQATRDPTLAQPSRMTRPKTTGSWREKLVLRLLECVCLYYAPSLLHKHHSNLRSGNEDDGMDDTHLDVESEEMEVHKTACRTLFVSSCPLQLHDVATDLKKKN